MTDVVISIEGGERFKEAAKRLGELPAEIRASLETGLLKSMSHIRSRVLLSGRVPYKTGTLRRSITTDVSNLEGEIGSNLPYAPIHEFGGKVKRFAAFGRKTKPYTATYKARQYIGVPLNDSLDRVRDIIDAEVGKALDAA